MSLELTIRSFAIAAYNSRSPFHFEIILVPDGLRIVGTTDDFRQMRTILWHDLALTRLPNWGSIVIDDMKQQLITRARIK